MANNCWFEMRVRGTRCNIEKLIDIMTYKDGQRFFRRIFSADIEFDDNKMVGITEATIFGDCAWSVKHCMIDGHGTYYDNLYRTGLQEESERLELEIEVYSDEQGCEFQEHYHYKNGECMANECVDCEHHFFEYIYNETEEHMNKRFEEFKKEEGLSDEVTIDDLDENDEIVIGGFGDWDFAF